MAEKGVLDLKSLKEQVYEYLRAQHIYGMSTGPSRSKKNS